MSGIEAAADLIAKQGFALRDLHVRLAREKAEKERDELREILVQMLTAYGAGEIVCHVPNGRWWPALEAAQNLLGARQETQLIRVTTEARP